MVQLEKCEKWQIFGVGLVCGWFNGLAIKGVQENETPGTVAGVL